MNGVPFNDKPHHSQLRTYPFADSEQLQYTSIFRNSRLLYCFDRIMHILDKSRRIISFSCEFIQNIVIY